MSRVRLSFLAALSLFAVFALSGCDKSSEGGDESGGGEEEATAEAEGAEGEAGAEGEGEGGAAPTAAAEPASDNPCTDYYEAVEKACRAALRGQLDFNCGHALVELKTLAGVGEGDLAKGQSGACRVYLKKVDEALTELDTSAAPPERDCATMAKAMVSRCVDPIGSGQVPPGCEMPIKMWSTMAGRDALDDATCQTVIGMLPEE